VANVHAFSRPADYTPGRRWLTRVVGNAWLTRVVGNAWLTRVVGNAQNIPF
jgi:hypothetical protein